MWRLNKVRHKAGRLGGSLEELKLKKREHEKGELSLKYVFMLKNWVLSSLTIKQCSYVHVSNNGGWQFNRWQMLMMLESGITK